MAQKVVNSVVDTGSVLVNLLDTNGGKIGEFEINPSDSGILSRYEKTVDYFNNVEFPDNLTDDEKLEKMKALDEGIKEQFDFLLNGEVSGVIFSRCNPLTVIASGDFFFEHVLEVIGSIIEKETDQRIKKKMKKVGAAVKKYGR